MNQMTKVIFEYSDGSIRYLEGEDVQKWNAFNQQVAFAAMIRNMNPPWESLKWKVGKNNEHEQKSKKESNEQEKNTSKED